MKGYAIFEDAEGSDVFVYARHVTHLQQVKATPKYAGPPLTYICFGAHHIEVVGSIESVHAALAKGGMLPAP